MNITGDEKKKRVVKKTQPITILENAKKMTIEDRIWLYKELKQNINADLSAEKKKAERAEELLSEIN